MNKTLITLVLASLMVAAPKVTAQSVTSPPAVGYKVAGRVVIQYPDINRAMPADVVILPGNDTARRGGPRLLRAAVAADGSFVFDSVPRGTHSLFVDRGVGFARIPLRVSTADLTAVELPLVPVVPVQVTYRVEGGESASGPLAYRAFFDSDYGIYGSVMPGTGSTPTILRLPAGATKLFFRPPAGYHLASVTAGSQDLLEGPLVLEPSATRAAVEVVLTRAVVSNRPVARVSVRVPPDHAGLEAELVNATSGSDGAIVGRTIVAADGTFEFTGITTGVYRLNLPPAMNVALDIPVLGQDVALDVPVPSGSLFGGYGVPVVDSAGRGVASWPGPIQLVAEGGSSQRAFPIRVSGFWGALPAGTYRIRVDGMPADYRVRSMSAGSANLLTGPFIVPAGRPAESIGVVLEVISDATPTAP